MTGLADCYAETGMKRVEVEVEDGLMTSGVGGGVKINFFECTLTIWFIGFGVLEGRAVVLAEEDSSGDFAGTVTGETVRGRVEAERAVIREQVLLCCF